MSFTASTIRQQMLTRATGTSSGGTNPLVLNRVVLGLNQNIGKTWKANLLVDGPFLVIRPAYQQGLASKSVEFNGQGVYVIVSDLYIGLSNLENNDFKQIEDLLDGVASAWRGSVDLSWTPPHVDENVIPVMVHYEITCICEAGGLAL